MKPYYSPSKALTSPASKDSTKLMGKEKILDRKDGKKETSSESIIRNGKSVYQLSSIIVHEGSADFGHYICFARPNLNTNPNLWLKLNDKTVTETDFKNVCETSFGSKNSEKNSRNAYLLFYTRKSN